MPARWTLSPNEENADKSLQPTPGSVTPPAGAGVAPVPSVADLWPKCSEATVDGVRSVNIFPSMKGKFTAIIEEAPEGGYWAICPEVPGANGQGETVADAKSSLRAAIRLIFEDRVEDARRGLPADAIQTVVAV